MLELVVRALTEHRQRQQQDKRAAGAEWIDLGLVFTTDSGRHVEPRNLNTAFVRLIARSGVRAIRFHDLRHTCATLLLSRGVSPRMVMDVLDHSQIAVTMNVYGHVIPAQQEAAGHMDAALSQQDSDEDTEDDQER